MSLQSQFDLEAINMLPIVKAEILKANKFESNQMMNYALRDICNSSTPISEMSEQEIEKFQLDLIEVFKFLGFIAN